MKRHITLTLDADAIEKAKEQGLNISQELNEHLVRITGGSESPMSAKVKILEQEKAGLVLRIREIEDRQHEEVRCAEIEARLAPYRKYYKRHNTEGWENRDAWLRDTASKLGLSLEELVRKLEENP